MSRANRKDVVELVSDIGAAAMTLREAEPEAVRHAIAFVVAVNPHLFGWLRDRLSEAPGLPVNAPVDARLRARQEEK